MSTPLLKDLYSTDFYAQFAQVLKRVIPKLDTEAFRRAIFAGHWPELELKDRMKHTTAVLHGILPEDFESASRLLLRLVDELEAAGMTTQRLEFMFLPDYVEQHGINHFQAAVQSMERITQFTSCEFAVRPFIVKYEARMMEQMLQWAGHPHEEVRRLASEGTRPRLPWAMALPKFKKDPAPVLPILEKLKADESLYVRRSVANHLNDISKDHPDITLRICRRWQGKSKDTDWLIKHACRTLLKAGQPEAMALFGFSDPEKIEIRNFQLSEKQVCMGDALSFSFQAGNIQSGPAKVRLEFGMYFLRANGSHSRKVFMIGERQMEASEQWEVEKSFSFKPLTTRRYYAGAHQIAIIVNGVVVTSESFHLEEC
jgi:3-methyladenine DNA glycosylase AlkC